MKFIDNFIFLVFQHAMLWKTARGQVTFTSQPSSPSEVNEGENLTLQWNYDVVGVSDFGFVVANVTDGILGAPSVVSRQAGGIATVQPGYKDKFRAAISDTQANLTVLEVPRSETGSKYVLRIIRTTDFNPFPSDVVEIKVLFPPSIVHISDNQTVTKGDDVKLNCTANGSPDATINWTRLSENITVEMPLTNITRQEEGGYRCTADNGIGSPATKDVFITVKYPPSITDTSGNITVNDSESVTLDCTADGFPAPNITWTRLSDNSVVNITFNITGKQDEGYYRCTADNGIGNPATGDIFITVKNYRPTNTRLVTNLYNNTVNLTGSINLTCSADANPPAKYQLYRERNSLINTTTGQDSFPHTTSVNERIEVVTYSCIPFNYYGEGPRETINVTVHYSPSDTGSGRNDSVPLGSSVSFTCPVDGNPEPNITWYKGNNAGGTVLFSGKTLNFPETKADDTGYYTCSASNFLGTVSITQCLTVVLPPTTTKPVGPTSATPTTKTTSKPTDDTEQEGPPWVVIGCVVGGVLVLVIVIAVVTCCVHKKRKCRKDTKIGHCESEGQVLQEGAADESAYSQVNQEYAGSGPPSANGTDGSGQQQAAAAVPTYAVVDKSKKKKNQQEEKPPEYAVVDKSKKKKKKKKDEKEDYTFAEADKSKKTSKKQQPRNADGLIYADLENIQRPQMPPVSTSPNALPPVKRPPAYEGTQYADITEFFKGDATLPKEGNSQVVEMQPQPRQ